MIIQEPFEGHFVDSDDQLNKNWKNYWNRVPISNETKRDIRREKAEAKRRIKQKSRRSNKRKLKKMLTEYRNY